MDKDHEPSSSDGNDRAPSAGIIAKDVAAALRELAATNPSIFNGFFEAFARIEASPEVNGYETYFINLGLSTTQARFLATVVCQVGRRLPIEKLASIRAATCLRSISRAKTPLEILERAKELFKICKEDTEVSAAVHRYSWAGKASGFHEILNQAVQRDMQACAELRAAASAMVSVLPNLSGRPASDLTSCHALFLSVLKDLNVPISFTWNGDVCTDIRTQATGQALGHPLFDSRPAWRIVAKG